MVIITVMEAVDKPEIDAPVGLGRWTSSIGIAGGLCWNAEEKAELRFHHTSHKFVFL